MDFVLLHNENNITDSIKISKCYSFDRYGGMLDDLTISFATAGHKIEFYENDKLEIKTAGGFSTGTMYLDSCIGNDGMFTIKALSCRHNNKKKKSKIWHKVKLSKILGDVAANTGLTLLLYGFVDYTYDCVAQIAETDLQLAARLCKREGYSIKCDNGNLIVFNEFHLENNATPIDISKDSVESGYYFTRSTNGLQSVTVRHFNTETLHDIFHTAKDESIDGGGEIRIEHLSDLNEAERFATGYLRDANKNHKTGALEMKYNGNISAGTVANLSGFEEFDGRYVVYEAKHDFVREITAIKVRQTLDY